MVVLKVLFLAALVLLPVVGLVLLIVGILKRRRARRALPPPPPGYPVPAVPAARRPGTALIAVGAAAMVLGPILGIVILHGMERVKVGQCITAAQYNKGDFHRIPTDCADEDAIYELASRGDASGTCPDGKGFGDTRYAPIRTHSELLCFVLNLQQGQCITDREAGTSRTIGYMPTSCDAPGASKGVQRVDGDNANKR